MIHEIEYLPVGQDHRMFSRPFGTYRLALGNTSVGPEFRQPDDEILAGTEHRTYGREGSTGFDLLTLGILAVEFGMKHLSEALTELERRNPRSTAGRSLTSRTCVSAPAPRACAYCRSKSRRSASTSAYRYAWTRASTSGAPTIPKPSRSISITPPPAPTSRGRAAARFQSRRRSSGRSPEQEAEGEY